MHVDFFEQKATKETKDKGGDVIKRLQVRTTGNGVRDCAQV
jgi:hypothetical protein